MGKRARSAALAALLPGLACGALAAQDNSRALAAQDNSRALAAQDNSRALAAPVKTSAPPAALSASSVPAKGRRETRLTVSRFGRYAVTVRSRQGVALQLVDRMSGPGELRGTAGEKDGRLDLFLDRGEYRVLALASPKGTGQATLAVRPFAERSSDPAPALVELKPVEAALQDFEQISYWIELGEARTVAIEAAGRNLADLRLWKDGSWLVDAEPEREVIAPAVGRPLLDCRLSASLPAGLYRLTAYGGPSQDWAEDSPGHPLHLRYGIPSLPEPGRQRFAVSPFGADRWLVPGNANYFRLELPEARPAALRVGWSDPAKPFQNDGEVQEIRKDSLPPVAEEDAESDQNKVHVVTVTGAAGQPYVLQNFESKPYYQFRASGSYWISTVSSGDPADSADATGILTRQSAADAQAHATPLREQTIPLDAKTGWARRCNLLGTLEVFLDIREAGSYEILSGGAEARFRIEPFLTDRPENYRSPDFQPGGSKWDLERGFAVLTIEPVRKGILDVVVRPAGLRDFGLERIGGEAGGSESPRPGSVVFPKVELAEEDSYTLYLNARPEIRTGVVLRPLPVDLSEPLPLTPPAGGEVEVPVTVGESGTLRCESESGEALEISVDGGPARKGESAVAAGPHRIRVHNAGKRTSFATLLFVPQRLTASAPLPPLPEETLATLPELPVLTEKAPRFFDLKSGESASYLVRAESPGLYRLETTGLLETEGNLRTRTVTSFQRDAANGVGRNFLIQNYLREGDYQVTVSPRGASEGHLGLALARTPLLDGGSLANGTPARILLPAGEAVAYTFVIPRRGQYRLRAMGLGHTFHCRLEDADGWPVDRPDLAADITRVFDRGTYRLLVLPEAVDNRVVTLLARTPVRRRLRGHGPHALALARPAEHEWVESDPRAPDQWVFAVPAPIDASIELTQEMEGHLFRLEPGKEPAEVAYVPPGRGWKGPLAMGSYRLEAVCTRINNHVAYTVAVWPDQVVAGITRDVAAPAELPISVGREGLVGLSSFGDADVRARLYDGSGRLVAENDDRPGDWNFEISRTLAAGAYRLRVDPVGRASASCSVTMDAPEETEEKPLSLPAQLRARPGRGVRLYPFQTSPGADLLLLSASSAEEIGLSLEAQEGNGWKTLGTAAGRDVRLEAPLPGGAALTGRVRLWSLDRRGETVDLSLSAVAAVHATESQLAGGIPLRALAGLRSPVAALVVKLDRPGLFTAETDAPGGPPALRACTDASQTCRRTERGRLAATGGALWILADLAGPGRSARLRATRILLRPGSSRGELVDADPGHPVLCDIAGGEKGPLVAVATSPAGQPGLRILERRGGAGDARRDAGMAVSANRAVAVSLGGSDRSAELWPADAEAGPISARLRVFRFEPPEAQPAPAHSPGGSWDGALAGPTARAYVLPRGEKVVRIALSGELVAALSRGGEPLATLAGGEAAPEDGREETVITDADRLALFHTGSGEDHFAVEVRPLAEPRAPAITPASSFERTNLAAGTLRVEIEGPAGARLHLRGAASDPVLLEASGIVARGSDVTLPGGKGTLLLPHGPGVVIGWIEGAERGGEAGLWGSPGAGETLEVRPPASIELHGRVQTLRIAAGGPAMLHLRSAAPAVTRVARGAEPPLVEAHPEGVLTDVYAPDGAAEISLRGVGDEPLWGAAEIDATSVTPIGEGLGPEVLLTAGGTRVFAFTAPRRGPVGIGVRASSDVVSCALLSEDGRTLGTGVVQMPDLPAGRYLLSLHAPRGAPPVRARPALAGLELPSTGPPQEVIRTYLEPEGEKAFSATRSAAARQSEAAAPAAESAAETAEEPAPEEGEASPEAPPEEEAPPPPSK